MRLDRVATRETLKPREEPYWERITVGQSLGYRPSSVGEAGFWSAKFYDAATRKKRKHSLGTYGHLAPNERHKAALKDARAWFEHLDAGGSHEQLTVKQVCENYADEIATEDEDKAEEIRRRFAQYVFNDPIARVLIQKLTKRQVEEWRKRLEALPAKVTRTKKKENVVTKARAKATVNRDMVPFRAALNRALERGEVLSSVAWATALKPYEGAGKRRDLYLSREQRKALIEALPVADAAFVRGLCSVPVRPGALAALTVADFDARRNQLTIGKDKAGAARRILLPAQTVALFKDQVRNKLPAARMFTRADGAPWTKNDWNDAIREVAESVDLPPGTTTYALRHSTITDLVVGGLDLLTVAQVAGTSVEMIEDHYGHLRQEHAAKALAALAL